VGRKKERQQARQLEDELQKRRDHASGRAIPRGRFVPLFVNSNPRGRFVTVICLRIVTCRGSSLLVCMVYWNSLLFFFCAIIARRLLSQLPFRCRAAVGGSCGHHCLLVIEHDCFVFRGFGYLRVIRRIRLILSVGVGQEQFRV